MVCDEGEMEVRRVTSHLFGATSGSWGVGKHMLIAVCLGVLHPTNWPTKQLPSCEMQ